MKIKGKSITPAQLLLKAHLLELGLEHAHTEFEYKFLSDRKYAFDIADHANKIAFECDGAQFSGGHMRGKAVEQQYEKDRLAQLHGWRVMRFTNRQILNGEAKQWLQEHLYPF